MERRRGAYSGSFQYYGVFLKCSGVGMILSPQLELPQNNRTPPSLVDRRDVVASRWQRWCCFGSEIGTGLAILLLRLAHSTLHNQRTLPLHNGT